MGLEQADSPKDAPARVPENSMSFPSVVGNSEGLRSSYALTTDTSVKYVPSLQLHDGGTPLTPSDSIGVKVSTPSDSTGGAKVLTPSDSTGGAKVLTPSDSTGGAKVLTPSDSTGGAKVSTPSDSTDGTKNLPEQNKNQPEHEKRSDEITKKEWLQMKRPRTDDDWNNMYEYKGSNHGSSFNREGQWFPSNDAPIRDKGMLPDRKQDRAPSDIIGE